MELEATLDGRRVQWQERRLVVRSVAWAQAQQQALETRLAKAQAELTALNERRQGKKRYTDEAELCTPPVRRFWPGIGSVGCSKCSARRARADAGATPLRAAACAGARGPYSAPHGAGGRGPP